MVNAAPRFATILCLRERDVSTPHVSARIACWKRTAGLEAGTNSSALRSRGWTRKQLRLTLAMPIGEADSSVAGAIFAACPRRSKGDNE
jgi:hypothetical protein